MRQPPSQYGGGWCASLVVMGSNVGTKEHAATNSLRASQPRVALNSAAVPGNRRRSLFELDYENPLAILEPVVDALEACNVEESFRRPVTH